MKPKVSVVIPIYNAEKYLRQCLDSIISQTLCGIEIICVNDGSTDGSLTIIEEYAAKDDRIKVISKPNAGYGHSMNMGLDAATGEYLGIVDSDDYILPDMYQTLYEIAKENDLDIARGGYYKFYEINGKEKRTYWSSMGGKYIDKVYCPKEAQEFYFSAVLTPSGIYKLEFIQTNGIRYNESPGAAFQDQGFWFKTHILADRVLFIKDAFYMYRFDNPNSSIYRKNSLEIMNGEYDFIKEFVDSRPDLSYLARPFYWKARFLNSKIIYCRLIRKINVNTVGQLAEPFRKAKENQELDISFFSREQLRPLEQLLASPSVFCKEEKVGAAYSLYREHVTRDLAGCEKGGLYKFSWFCKHVGIFFALSLVKRKIVSSCKSKIKSVGKKINFKWEKFHTKVSPTYAKQRKVIDEMAAFLASQKEKEFRANQMFWWTINQPNETLTETKQRFFLNLPKAEGKLRERQIEYIAVLEELKQLLDKNGIIFWPMGGTMVGMLRHKGFIPWDDDVDISMMYEDKERLFELVEKSGTLKIEEVYWCGSTVLRCPRVTFKDRNRTGLVDIFLWERANEEPTGFAPLWNKRNRFSNLMNREYRAIKHKLNKLYSGETIENEQDRKLLESIFERHRVDCLKACGTGGSTIYGSIDMWFQAGKWRAVYDKAALYPMKPAEFEGTAYQVPNKAEQFLTDQYGNWMDFPNKVRPTHGG